MSPEFYAIIGVGVSTIGVLSGLMIFLFSILSRRMDRLESRMDRLESRVDRLEDTLIQRMNRLEDKVDRLIEQAHSLDIRVSKLDRLAEARGEFRREQIQFEDGDSS